jgi:signal transduction histidine kinase
MKKNIILGTICSSLLATSAFAVTKADTKKIVEDTVKYCQSVSKTECLKSIDDNKFENGELFIFAFDYESKGVANGRIKKLIGKKLWNLKNPDGIYVFREQIKVAKKPNGGWLEYKWKKPDGTAILKLSYIKDVDGTFYVGSGMTVK